MATTKDEATQAEKAVKEVVVSKSVTEADVLALYQKGKNYYQIAEEVFGFDSDDAVDRIRQIVENR